MMNRFSLLTLSAAAGCSTTLPAHCATPHEAGSSSQEVRDEQRGIHPERDRIGLDHVLQVRRSKNDVARELHDGDKVMTGDRIHANVQTSEDAYLYLAFCANQELAVYPSQRGIRTRAGELMVVPPAGVELVFDGDPGPEVLYVILSRTEISIADPHLAHALAAQRPSNRPVDCGANLDAELAKPSSYAGATQPPAPSSTNVLRGAMVRKKQIPPTHALQGHSPSNSAKTEALGPAPGSSGGSRDPSLANAAPSRPNRDLPVPDYERNVERNPGAIVWYRAEGSTGPDTVVAADEDGIAVVRHEFIHKAPGSPP